MATAKKAKAPAKKKAAKKAATKRAPRTPDANRVEQNGIPAPREGSDSAKVFAIADTLRKQTKEVPKRAEVLAAAEKAKVNPATAATQFARWRTFNGIEGRASA